MKKLIHMFILTTVLVLAACGGDNSNNNTESNQGPATNAISEGIEPFEATTQNGDTMTLEDLNGKWWVANFVFTNCTTVCPPMTRNMKVLQDKLGEESIENVQLVSFSVDPERDTPEVLTEYANDHGADFVNWSFLTGYDFETIKNISMNSFKSMLMEPPEGDDQITHTVAFFLVNPEGEVVSKFDGTKADDMDAIVAELKELQ